jgi:hypothetical protein
MSGIAPGRVFFWLAALWWDCPPGGTRRDRGLDESRRERASGDVFCFPLSGVVVRVVRAVCCACGRCLVGVAASQLVPCGPVAPLLGGGGPPPSGLVEAAVGCVVSRRVRWPFVSAGPLRLLQLFVFRCLRTFGRLVRLGFSHGAEVCSRSSAGPQ